MFAYKQKTNQFLEWEKVFDNFYGTPSAYVQEQLKTGMNVLLCIDVKGARQVRKKEPDSVGIFVKTSSLEELKKRLTKRGSESTDVLKLRFNTAKNELKDLKFYEYVIINDHLTTAYKNLHKIILQIIRQKNCVAG
ncbi:MAG: guanylate kinase, partial [Candidatus Omnitrophica bacterium]|nr:guanylate kinase [Candidatus Omnitrophota bacterium]